MRRLYTILAALTITAAANAQTGAPYIHDPSTIAECDGKYYTFGTGGGGLISEDGWSWHSGAERPGGGAAPDVLKIGDRYLVIYGATGGGLGGGHNGRILTMWNKTLDPKSPDFHYTDAVEVCYSDGMEDQDAIDPGMLLDPTTGRLWVSYGTYFGTIRLIELDPATGCPVENDLLSVTVVTADGATADALSTALFVMGAEGALEFYEARDDFELVLITEDGRVTVTPGLRDAFRETAAGEYTYEYLD